MSLGNWLANKILIPEADLIDEFLITHDLARIINEGNSVTTAVGMEVDDGPKMYHKSYEQYKLRTRKQTEAMGMEVLDYRKNRP